MAHLEIVSICVKHTKGADEHIFYRLNYNTWAIGEHSEWDVNSSGMSEKYGLFKVIKSSAFDSLYKQTWNYPTPIPLRPYAPALGDVWKYRLEITLKPHHFRWPYRLQNWWRNWRGKPPLYA